MTFISFFLIVYCKTKFLDLKKLFATEEEILKYFFLKIKMVSKISFALLLCVPLITGKPAQPQVSDGLYRIENKIDHLHITTEGANAAFARIVGENWQNFGEQRWKVEKTGGSYSLTPQKHSTNNVISFFKDPTKKYALPERWELTPVKGKGGDYFQLHNLRTGLCLISNGRRKEISEGACDKHLPDRHWRFVSI